MKKLRRILLATLVAIVAASCSSAYYTAGGSAYDDLYATHNRTEIANRQKAEAEARRAEAEARKAEAEALQAEYEAKIAAFNAQAAAEGKQTIKTQTASTLDEVIVLEDNSAQNFVADSYESAYARRLKGFRSPSYRMPSSYFNLRYTGDVMLATAYDPSFYNIMVSGDQVWVEPRYITSMFGTWGATNATALIYSPWYYGWNTRWGIGWGAFDPWYYSSWGFPRYSWYDWNWNICYGSSWGLGLNLWWGWGGIYRPWRPYHYHHHHHIGGIHHHHGHFLGGGGGYINHYYGSRHNAPRNSHGPAYSSRNIVNRGSGYSTPYRSTNYRSPNSGKVYGETVRSKVTTPAQGSAGRSQVVNRYTGTSRSKSYTQPSTQSRPSNSGNITRNNSSSRSSYRSGSSFGSSSSTRGGGSSFSGGSSGGGSRSGGSRGR